MADVPPSDTGYRKFAMVIFGVVAIVAPALFGHPLDFASTSVVGSIILGGIGGNVLSRKFDSDAGQKMIDARDAQTNIVAEEAK